MNLRLRAIRENLEITQKDIAKKLKVTPAYYNFLENFLQSGHLMLTNIRKLPFHKYSP